MQKAFGNQIKKLINRYSNLCRVYDVNLNLIGNEHVQISPISRSVDENIAQLGRTAFFHKDTIVTSSSLLYDTTDNQRYFLSALRTVGLAGEAVTFSSMLLQIDADADVYREEDTYFNPDSGEVKKEFIKKIENLPVYIQKKDWTMESITAYGRDQKGYETFLCQNRDIQKGDRITCGGKQYIVQDINRVLRKNMLSIQVGLNIKHV